MSMKATVTAEGASPAPSLPGRGLTLCTGPYLQGVESGRVKGMNENEENWYDGGGGVVPRVTTRLNATTKS